MSSSSDPTTDQASDVPLDDPTSEEVKAEQQSTTPGNGNAEEQGQGGGGEEGEEEEEEEEGECGFCLFMRGGGCKDTFVAWEDCIKEAGEKGDDIVEKCYQATSALKLCMEAHADYYAPILGAEKAAEKEALEELEKEKAARELESSGKDKDEDSST